MIFPIDGYKYYNNNQANFNFSLYFNFKHMPIPHNTSPLWPSKVRSGKWLSLPILIKYQISRSLSNLDAVTRGLLSCFLIHCLLGFVQVFLAH